MGSIDDIVKTFTAALEQMKDWPMSMLLAASLVVLGYGLRLAHWFSNRYIPVVIMGVGIVGNIFIAEPGSVDPTHHHPTVVLGAQGLMIGFASWISHALVLKRLERFLPALGGNGKSDTQTTVKPPEEK